MFLMLSSLGDLSRLFHRLAWDFHKTLIYEYGPVSVVRGLFGVWNVSFSSDELSELLIALGKNGLCL